MAAKLEHGIRIGREDFSKALLGGTGEFARVVKAPVNGVIRFHVIGPLGIGQTVQVREVAKAGPWQGPKRFRTGIGAFDPGHEGSIHNPPVATGGVGGPVKTEISGLHNGKPLSKKLRMVISGVATEIEQKWY